jgi:rhodanese-related sulfurtransferase
VRAALLQATVLVLLSAVAGAISYRFHPRAPALYLFEETVAEDEVNLRMALDLESKGGVLWIDARSRAEFEKSHVPGAHLLNAEEWETLMFEMVDVLSSNTKPIIIYCDSQKCDQSRLIAEKLRDLGNQDIRVLRGGWQAWQNQPK